MKNRNQTPLFKVFKFKNLKFLFLLALLILSWRLIESKKKIPKEVQLVIQKDVQHIISKSLQKNIPHLKNLDIKRISIKALNQTTLQVYFSYSYEDRSKNEPVKIQIVGKAKIKKNKESRSNQKAWTVDQLQILENEINFEKGLTISSK